MVETTRNVRLQQAREKRGWTQWQVADMIGVSANDYSRWERGVYNPQPYTRVKLCKLFGKTEQELGIDKDEALPRQRGRPHQRGALPGDSEVPDERGFPRQQVPTAEEELRQRGRPHQRGASQSPDSMPLPQPSSTTPLFDLYMKQMPIIGREEDIEKVYKLVQERRWRIISLIGPPGVGKTRLALEVGKRLETQYPHRYLYISLAHLLQPDEARYYVVNAINMQVLKKNNLADVIADLRATDFCLILDNFEQLLMEGVAAETKEKFAALVGGCDRLFILLTSRAELEIPLEQSFAVQPLAFPSSGQAVTVADISDEKRYPATSLYLLYAKQASHANFSPTQADVPYIVALCQLLSGLPLAIQLVAGHIRTHSPKQAYEELSQRTTEADSRNDILKSRYSEPTVPGRHLTLEKAIDWSYDLLSDLEKKLFRRFPVYWEVETMDPDINFKSGEYDNDIKELCARFSIDNDLLTDISPVLFSLVHFNLLKAQFTHNEYTNRVWFSMLPVIRDYALRKANETVIDGMTEVDRVKGNWPPLIPLS